MEISVRVTYNQSMSDKMWNMQVTLIMCKFNSARIHNTVVIVQLLTEMF